MVSISMLFQNASSSQ